MLLFLSYFDFLYLQIADVEGYIAPDHTRWHIHTHTHTHTPLLGLLWTTDRPITETSTHSTHTGQKSMHPEGFYPAIPASERPQTHALDRADTYLMITVK